MPGNLTSPAKSVVHGDRLYATFSVPAEEDFVNLKCYVLLYRLSLDKKSWEKLPLQVSFQTEGHPSALLSNKNGLFLVMQSKDFGDQIFQISSVPNGGWTTMNLGMTGKSEG